MTGNELATLLRRLQAGLDEHEARLGQLETRPMVFNQAETASLRRRVTRGMRDGGMPIDAIAATLQVSTHTTMSDLRALSLAPAQVHGRDGKTYPSSRNGNGRVS